MAAQNDTAKQLEELIATLQDERQQHTDAIAEIDETFQRLGIEPQQRPRDGRRPGPAAKAPGEKKTAKTGRGRGRRRYGKTAEAFILDLLKGGKALTTRQVNDAWTKAGRPGNAATTLTRMVKEGKIDRENIPGARGSTYRKK